MTFRPSIHGWPFGHVEGVDAHVLGLGALPTAEPPLGGGLCWAALDRYLRGVRIPTGTSAPEPGEPLHSELIRRQVASFSGVWGRVREWQGRPDGSWRDRLPVRVPGGRDLAALSRAEWRSTRSRLNGGEPVLLTLLLPVDPYRRPRGARQVLATRWKLDDGRVVVSVYDPERPGDDNVELCFCRAGPLDARLSDGSEVRGFMAIPYDRVAPAPLRAETFGDRSVLGLNRKVRGGLAAATGRRRLDLVARNAEGALLHFSRIHGGSWEGANVTDREEFGSYELYSDPVAVRSVGLHVFARNYVGDLLHFRLGRQWSVANRTDHKRAGARFRLVSDPVPVPGHRGRISVLGLDKDGGLVHYSGHPLLGWSAEQVAGDPLSGDPVSAWEGSTLHVAGTARDGRVLHWEWDGDTWSATDLSTAPGVSASTVAGRIVLRVVDGAVHIAARSKDQKPVVYHKAVDTAWSEIRLENALSGDPVLGGGPAGPHLFAPLQDGGVLHAWSDGASHRGAWLEERLLDSRSSLPTVPHVSRLACWGSAEELRLWVRADGDLWMLIWRPDSDWVLERLSDRSGVAERHRPGDDPVVVEDATGLPHLFFTDGRGTVLHVEPSSWEAPGTEAGSGAAAPVRAEARTDATSAAAVRPEERSAQKPAPAARSVLPEPEQAQSAPEATNSPPLEAARTAPKPTAKPVEGASELPEDLPYLDFELDPPPPRVPAGPSPASAAGEAVGSAPEGPRGGESPGVEASAKESAPAPREGDPLPPPPGLPGLELREDDDAPDGGEPDAPARKDFRWGGGSPAKGSPPIEPMDLNLLDSWPTAPPSLRKRDEKEQGSDRKSS